MPLNRKVSDSATMSAGAQPRGDRPDAIDRLGREFIRFSRLMKSLAIELGGPDKDGVEIAAYRLLAHIVREGPARATDLAEAVHTDTSTVSRQTAALVRHGLLERQPDPLDGRASLLAATAEGRRVFNDRRRRHNGYLAKTLDGWQLAELRQLLAVLGRLNTDLETHRAAQVAGGAGFSLETDGHQT